jgi:hypothetical protein
MILPEVCGIKFVVVKLANQSKDASSSLKEKEQYGLYGK